MERHIAMRQMIVEENDTTQSTRRNKKSFSGSYSNEDIDVCETKME